MERGEDPPTSLEEAAERGLTRTNCYVPFNELDPEERRKLQERGRETQRRRREEKKAADEAAYIEMVRRHALEVLEVRVETMRSLREKGVRVEIGEDGEPTGETVFDASLLTKEERRDLIAVTEQLEKRAHGNYKGKLEQQVEVSVIHQMQAARRQMLAEEKRLELGGGDDVVIEDAEVVEDDEDDLELDDEPSDEEE